MEGYFATDALEHEIVMAEKRLLNPSLENRDTIASIHAFIDRARKAQEKLPQKNIGIQNFSSFELCGEGSFGIVWKCQINGQPVALKQEKLSAKVSVSENFRERDILIELKHPNIIKLLGALYDGNVFYVFEKCEGDTAVYLQNIQQQHLEGMVSQLLSAVVFMHSKQIIHRDIKPANILLTNDSNIKLADFGTACQLSEGLDSRTVEYETGTFCYSPIEVLQHGEFSKKSDLFSVGATIFEWDKKFPLLGSRVKGDGDAQFYYDAQVMGRIEERKEGEHYVYITGKNHKFRREKISERIYKSSFGRFLEVTCNQSVHLRPASDKVMSLTVLKTAFNKLREKAKTEHPASVVPDGGKLQKAVVKSRNAPPFNKAGSNDDKMQEMIGFYYEDPEFFATANPQIECFEKARTMVNRSVPTMSFSMVDKSVPKMSCCMVDKEVHTMSYHMVEVECQTNILVKKAIPVVVYAGPNPCLSKSLLSTTDVVTINFSAGSKNDSEKNEIGNLEHFASKSAETSTSVQVKEKLEGRNTDILSRGRPVNKGYQKQQKRSRKPDGKPGGKLALGSLSGFEKRCMKENHKKKQTKFRGIDSSDSELNSKHRKQSRYQASREPELSSSSKDEEYRFECRLCRKKFKRAGNLSRHEETHQKEFRCKKCRKEFDSQDDLSTHIDTHSNKLKTKKCPWCREGLGQGVASYGFHLKICKRYNGGENLRGLQRKYKAKEGQ